MSVGVLDHGLNLRRGIPLSITHYGHPSKLQRPEDNRWKKFSIRI